MDYPAQPRQLPHEIVDIIIDDDSHDQAVYKELALVSTSFLHRSRRHFFREITFSGDSANNRAMRERFSEILHANPDIASYVRNLHIKDKSFQVRTWIQEEETIQGILLILAKNHISELTLEINLFWTSFSAGLKHALTQILTTPTLVKLTLSSISNLPVSCCTHFPRLQHLLISNVDLDDSEDFDQREVATVKISSLVINDIVGRSTRLFGNILGLRTTNSTVAFLEKLKISDCDSDFTQEVVWASRKSLRCLALDTTDWSYPDVINIKEHGFLNRLELKCDVDHEEYETCLLRILETGGPNKELRNIHITLYQYSYSGWVDHFSREDTVLFWRRLAAILERFFSSLVDVVIELEILQRWRRDHVGEEQKIELERIARNRLSSGGGNFASNDRVLLVKISVDEFYR